MKAIKIKYFKDEFDYQFLHGIVQLWKSKERKLGRNNFEIITAFPNNIKKRNYAVYETKTQIVVIKHG